jgi:hypothetical protein
VSTEMPSRMRGLCTPRGHRVHLYDVEGDRRSTLCGSMIGVNPLTLIYGPYILPADRADCSKCRRLALEETS